MEHTAHKPEKDSVSLYVIIAVCIGVAFMLVGIAFTTFLQSSTYQTVKDIRANTQISNSELGGYDTISPVKAVDIEETMKNIENQLSGLDNSADYGPQALTDESLGL